MDSLKSGSKNDRDVKFFISPKFGSFILKFLIYAQVFTRASHPLPQKPETLKRSADRPPELFKRSSDPQVKSLGPPGVVGGPNGPMRIPGGPGAGDMMLEPTGPMPRFGDTPQVVASSPGSTTYLRCTVYDLGPYTVSWVRRNHLHILTVGEFTFASDNRYRVLHLDNKQDWNLQISNIQPEDAGVYECQVSTDPKISREVNLNVADATTTMIPPARVEIKGSGLVERGNPINLTCNATGEPFPPAYIEWYKNGNKVESDALRGIVITNVIKFTTVSVMTIERAHMHDAGEYICRTSTHEFATKKVHVLNGTTTLPVVGSAAPVNGQINSLPFLLAILSCIISHLSTIDVHQKSGTWIRKRNESENRSFPKAQKRRKDDYSIQGFRGN